MSSNSYCNDQNDWSEEIMLLILRQISDCNKLSSTFRNKCKYYTICYKIFDFIILACSAGIGSLIAFEFLIPVVLGLAIVYIVFAGISSILDIKDWAHNFDKANDTMVRLKHTMNREISKPSEGRRSAFELLSEVEEEKQLILEKLGYKIEHTKEVVLNHQTLNDDVRISVNDQIATPVEILPTHQEEIELPLGEEAVEIRTVEVPITEENVEKGLGTSSLSRKETPEQLKRTVSKINTSTRSVSAPPPLQRQASTRRVVITSLSAFT